MLALICWTPPITRLFTKSRTRMVSGAENGAAPRKTSEPADPLEPRQQPQRNDQLRFRSVPISFVPALGWRFLRHDRRPPPAVSYSLPSGLMLGTIQISRVSTTLWMRASIE